MNALYYIVETLISLVFIVLLLRLVLQFARADFRNPIAQAIVKLTNPVIVPLRRILPPAGKVDTASVVAVVLVALAEIGLLHALRGFGTPDVFTWLRIAALRMLTKVLWLYFYAIVLYALLSLIAPGQHTPISSLLA